MNAAPMHSKASAVIFAAEDAYAPSVENIFFFIPFMLLPVFIFLVIPYTVRNPCRQLPDGKNQNGRL